MRGREIMKRNEFTCKFSTGCGHDITIVPCGTFPASCICVFMRNMSSMTHQAITLSLQNYKHPLRLKMHETFRPMNRLKCFARSYFSCCVKHFLTSYAVYFLFNENCYRCSSRIRLRKVQLRLKLLHSNIINQ